jgi:hypothetical protein
MGSSVSTNSPPAPSVVVPAPDTPTRARGPGIANVGWSDPWASWELEAGTPAARAAAASQALAALGVA